MGCTTTNWQLLGIFQILPFIIFIASISKINSLTPQSPIQCNKTICTLQNSYGTWGDRKNCYALNVTYPTTEEQLRLAVSYVVQNSLKAKIVTKFSHTIPKLACPQQNALFISTEKYDSGIQIDSKSLSVIVDSGVGLRQLIDEVERNGFSLVAAPYWEGVTIGGLISTGAHGSSLWGKGGSVHDHVLGISIVVPASKSEGYAKILWLEGKDPLFSAAKVSLGVLGAISKVSSCWIFLGFIHVFPRFVCFFRDQDVHCQTLSRMRSLIQRFKIVPYPRRRSNHRLGYEAPLNP